MRKKIILLVINSLLVISVEAQGFKGGLHVGLLATQVDGDTHSGYKKAGLFAGAFTNYSFANEKIKLQFELNYAQKGSRETSAFRIKLHQVEPTALFRWNFWNHLFLSGGLSVNVLASGKMYKYNEIVTEDIGTKFYLFNVEGIAEIGYSFHEHWGGSFRYIYSTPIGTTAKLKNGKVVQGYMFNNCMLFRLYYQF